MNKFFTALVVSFCLVLGFFLPVFSAEQLSITTYYPSPYGVYVNLRTDQMAIGSGYRASAIPGNGLIVQGNVGIGMFPSYPLDVSGNIAANDVYLKGKGALVASMSWCTRMSYTSNSGMTTCPSGTYSWFQPVYGSSPYTIPTSGSFLCCS